MRLNIITGILALSILVCVGCEAYYDIDQHFGEFEPRVVLNSVITPESHIAAILCWSKYYGDTADYEKIDSFSVELYEDGNLLESFDCENGLFYSFIYPQESKTYRVKVTVPNYGEINASTYIPAPVSATVEYVKMLEADPESSGLPFHFAHFKVTEISSKEKVRALWVMTESIHYPEDVDSLPIVYTNKWVYSDNEFIDKINARKDFWCSQAKGSSFNYNMFMRIAYADFEQATPLDFSIETMGRYEQNRHNTSDISDQEDLIDLSLAPQYTKVSLITPSEDYDKYQESLYESAYINPFGSGSSSVYSNVENGLGVFIGYSSTSYEFRIDGNK